MSELRDFYAPPQTAIAETATANAARGRVGGGIRLLAAVLEALPLFLVSLWAVYEQRTRGRVSPILINIIDIYLLAWILAGAICEIAFAASPGMLLLGLRVRRATGAPATTSRLAMKALLVRIPQLPVLPSRAATALALVTPVAASWTATPPAISRVVTVLELVWTIGYLLAFGKRRQTHIDRVLDLAVYRK